MSSPVHSPRVATPTAVSAYSPGKAIGFALCIILGFGGWFLLINVNQKWFAAKLLSSLSPSEAHILKLLSGVLGSVFLAIGVVGSVKNRSTYALPSVENERDIPDTALEGDNLSSTGSIESMATVAMHAPLGVPLDVPSPPPEAALQVARAESVAGPGAGALVARTGNPLPAENVPLRAAGANPLSSTPVAPSAVVNTRSSTNATSTVSLSSSQVATRAPLQQTLALSAPQASQLVLWYNPRRKDNPTQYARSDRTAISEAQKNPWIIFFGIHPDQLSPGFLTMSEENTHWILAFPSLCRYYLPTYIHSNEVDAVKNLLSVGSVLRHPYFQPLLDAECLPESIPEDIKSWYLPNRPALEAAYTLLNIYQQDLYVLLLDSVKSGIHEEIFHALWKEDMAVRNLLRKAEELFWPGRDASNKMRAFFGAQARETLLATAAEEDRGDILLFCADQFPDYKEQVLWMSRYNPIVAIHLANKARSEKDMWEYKKILRSALQMFFAQPMLLAPEKQLPRFKVIYRAVKDAGFMPKNYFSEILFSIATNLNNLSGVYRPEYHSFQPAIKYLLSEEQPSQEFTTDLLSMLKWKVAVELEGRDALLAQQKLLEGRHLALLEQEKLVLLEQENLALVLPRDNSVMALQIQGKLHVVRCGLSRAGNELDTVQYELMRANTRVACSQDNLRILESYYQDAFSALPEPASNSSVE